MRWKKTELALQALQQRESTLSVRQRQILIVVDGRRTTDDVAQLFGPEASKVLDALRNGGWIAPISPAPVAPQTAAAPVGVPAAVFSAQRAAEAPAARKSLAAARMYLSDILLMTRRPAASAWASTLQACRDEQVLVQSMAQACIFLTELQGPGMAEKIIGQLQKFLPENLLPHFSEHIASADLVAVVS